MLSKFWTDLSSDEIKKIGKNKILVFPFSSVEQHGSHLPSGTDKLILEGILEKFVSKYPKLNNFLILPNISIGSASEHSNFEGTISANSTKYIDYIVSIVEQFCERKYKKFLFINSHGGQISHLDIVAKEIKSKYKFVDIIKANYFLFKGYEKIINKKELFYGYHGGEFETSIMLYLYPKSVKSDKIKKLIDNEVQKVNDKVARVEQIKKFRLIDVLLTADDDEMTATMKLKRGIVEKKYKSLINSMYK